jgi:GNAT superfamily N-acetyltransferase
MVATAFEISELQLPESLDGPGGMDFSAMVHVHNAVEAAAYGTDLLALRAEELLPHYRLQKYERRRIFLARIGGLVVGRAVLEWSTDDEDPASWFVVEVLPEFRRRGIGTALADLVESLHAESGRPVLQGFVAHGRAPADAGVLGGAVVGGAVVGGGLVVGGVVVGGRAAAGRAAGSELTGVDDDAAEILVPSTGYGSIPASDPGARFLLRRGFTLEQVSRGSVLALPFDEAELLAHRTVAERGAGPDYRVVLWSGPTPEDRRGDVAALYTRMSTDEPVGGLAVVEERWDEARLIDEEESLQGGGRTLLTAAAEHVPSGRLVGFTRLSLPADRLRAAEQEETIVLDRHRGHRLGMLVKVANLQYLAEVAPETPLVFTFNAEENRHMLRVNEALGFIPIGYEGSWKKSTPPA